MPSNCSYWKAIPEVKQFTTDVVRSQSIFAFSSYSLLVLLIKLAICFVSSLTTLAEKACGAGRGFVLGVCFLLVLLVLVVVFLQNTNSPH